MSAIGINPSTADDCLRYRWLITARNINKHLSNPPQLFMPKLLAVKNNQKYHSAARALMGPLCKVHLAGEKNSRISRKHNSIRLFRGL
jgi:hypothetical protein